MPAWLHAGAQLLIIYSLLLGVKGSSAMWAQMSDEELISSSDLIVIGVWEESPPIRNPVLTSPHGNIAVSKVLKGKARTSVRVAQPSGQTARSSTDLIFLPGDNGLWLLRQTPENKELYFVDHPQRFVPAAGGEDRIRSLTRSISR